jgi:DNA adenine methylase
LHIKGKPQTIVTHSKIRHLAADTCVPGLALTTGVNETVILTMPNPQPTTHNSQLPAHPFLKWAGGKTQLLEQFRPHYPAELKDGKIKKYFEPFVGGGAVFFDIVQNYKIERAYLSDINDELVIAYQVIQRDSAKLIEALSKIATKYRKLDKNAREQYFYEVRDKYNKAKINYDIDYSDRWVSRVAQMIFLNKTCYNGLFRVNRKGEFNVPFGQYKNPTILDKNNIIRVSILLQKAEIRSGGFDVFTDSIDKSSFVYFDPPYRPISQTSSFTSYSKYEFEDKDQIRLGRYFRRLNHETGARLMLSNSDPSNENKSDRFFDRLYRGFNVHRVSATRMINCRAEKRGEIKELIITNY